MDKVELTPSQKKALETLESGRNTFLTGEAGTGKSFLLRHFVTKVKSFKTVLLSAPTGIASINIQGVTLHRLFGLGTDVLSLAQAPTLTQTAETLKNADILVIDEISMCRLDVFEKVMKTLKLANPTIQVVLVGDFLQLPPVLTSDEAEVYEDLHGDRIYAFESDLWQEFSFVTKQLTEVVRQKDPTFIDNLNMARRGNHECISYFNALDTQKPKEAIAICSRNKKANSINYKKLEKIDEEAVFYRADTEILQSGFKLTNAEKPMDELITLKKGARVLLCVNLSDKELFNGQMGTVVDLDEDGVNVVFDDGKEVRIGKYQWSINAYETTIDKKTKKKKTSLITIATFTQIPLKLGFAITIHKSQGQTYEKAVVYPSCWARGQLYVALSRVSSAQGLHLASEIKDNYLVADQKVLDFYNRKDEDEKDSFVTKQAPTPAKTGRKRKFAGLDTRTVRLPVAYIDFVTKLCNCLSVEDYEEARLLLAEFKNQGEN